jgi:hypothetical protein
VEDRAAGVIRDTMLELGRDETGDIRQLVIYLAVLAIAACLVAIVRDGKMKQDDEWYEPPYQRRGYRKPGISLETWLAIGWGLSLTFILVLLLAALFYG